MSEKAAQIRKNQTGLDLYCWEKPFPKQQLALDETCDEIFFGGAAGGAKSSVLGMMSLRYIHVPHFSALLIRKTMKRLERSGGLLERMISSWLPDHIASRIVRYNATKHTIYFPNHASITFGFLDTPMDRFEYQGQEYQFIGVDELPELVIPEGEADPWLFLRSRLRRPKCDRHKKFRNGCVMCQKSHALANVPLHICATGNPGGVSHNYVSNRFLTEEAKQAMLRGDTDRVFYRDINTSEGIQRIAFIPSLIKDNPYIDLNEYRMTLAHLGDITRRRLMDGDWLVVSNGLIKHEDIREADIDDDGNIILYNPDGSVLTQWHESESYRFATCDPAGTSKDRADTARGKDHSYTVIAVFDQAPQSIGPYLVVRHVLREQVNFPQLCDRLLEVDLAWSPAKTRIENEKLGQAAVDQLCDEMPIETVPTGGKDKPTRAGPLCRKFERHEVFIVRRQPWTDATIGELSRWKGLPEDDGDIVDALAYGAIESEGKGSGVWPAKLFQDVFVDDPSGFERSAVWIQAAEPDSDGYCTGGLFAAGVRGDGAVYVRADIGTYTATESVERLIDYCRPFGLETNAVAISNSHSRVLADRGLKNIIRANVKKKPKLFSVETKKHLELAEYHIESLLTTGQLKFISGDKGALRIVNRLKSWPHGADPSPVHGLAMALVALSRSKKD